MEYEHIWVKERVSNKCPSVIPDKGSHSRSRISSQCSYKHNMNTLRIDFLFNLYTKTIKRSSRFPLPKTNIK